MTCGKLPEGIPSRESTTAKIFWSSRAGNRLRQKFSGHPVQGIDYGKNFLVIPCRELTTAKIFWSSRAGNRPRQKFSGHSLLRMTSGKKKWQNLDPDINKSKK
jgi:hypothetical protein